MCSSTHTAREINKHKMSKSQQITKDKGAVSRKKSSLFTSYLISITAASVAETGMFAVPYDLC